MGCILTRVHKSPDFKFKFLFFCLFFCSCFSSISTHFCRGTSNHTEKVGSCWPLTSMACDPWQYRPSSLPILYCLSTISICPLFGLFLLSSSPSSVHPFLFAFLFLPFCSFIPLLQTFIPPFTLSSSCLISLSLATYLLSLLTSTFLSPQYSPLHNTFTHLHFLKIVWKCPLIWRPSFDFFQNSRKPDKEHWLRFHHWEIVWDIYDNVGCRVASCRETWHRIITTVQIQCLDCILHH